MKVVSPATGEPIGEIAEDDAASVATAVQAARAAQPDWAERPLDERIEVVRRFRAGVAYRRDELAEALTEETGKPITQARNELDGLLPRIDFFLDAITAAVADEVVLLDGSGIEEVISYEPVGVVANVSAWNYPWFVGSNVWVPALLTGNAVVYKPSECAPRTGDLAADLFRSAGVPEAVFGVVQGLGEVGAALVAAEVDAVCFTGSYATGRRIAEATAGRMLRVQLELGGKDPVYVCDDVDVAVAAAGIADGAFYNAGQSCCSVERVYVHERIHDEFVARFLEVVRGFPVGDPHRDDTYIGPLTRSAQVPVIEAQVADAVARGATLRQGGHRIDRPGNWFEPTVLTDVDATMSVMREETFGPVIGIQRVGDDDEALAAMNDTDYGLTAGVYTADEERATSILRRVRAGSAYWNCCDRVSPRLPWSGRGHSGVGATLGVEGIRAFTRPKAWHLRQP